uniref:Rab11 family-interacting protein 2 n=1 Tax=Geotrypetes seraphini TaxID=260995 RepID=A0A6P8R6Y3_GEOSA|nr:rab11 family-interacting protein 1 [Geotrypetes seraphini]
MSLGQQSQIWFPTHVQVTVLQAKALRTKGKAGTNDAYCIFQLGKEKYSTSVAEKSLAPVWKEEATFELPLLHQGNQERCTLYVIAMHRALVGLDKFLGQAALNLWELHQEKNRRKSQWYKLQSKPGKKEKERGQIEIDVQFMRNNMTASLFDLSMHEKSQSPFRKLKDKIKRKQHDGLPDTASAIVPSITRSAGDSDEENAPQKEKKKNKIKNLFSKSGLQKNTLSQSMTVLPTFQPAPVVSEKTVLRPSDFKPCFDDVPLSPKSEDLFQNKTEGRSSKLLHLPGIRTHKRTVSADPSQVNQMTSGNTKKEGLSFFSGLRSKNDPITRSNLCINGNHVYTENTEPKSDTLSKDSNLSTSPLVFRKTPVYASADNLSSRSLDEVATTAGMPADKNVSRSLSKDALKSMTMPSYKASNNEESGSSNTIASFNPPKEMKEEKILEKQQPALEESQNSSAPVSIDPPKETKESKKSSLLSLVTGKKDVAKSNEDGPFSEVSFEEREKPVNSPKKDSEVALTEDAPSKKKPFNPFDEDLAVEEKKPEPPLASARTTKTSAVKPRLDVSSEDETKARIASASPLSEFSFSLSNDLDPFSFSPKMGKEINTQDFENLSTQPPALTSLNTSLSWSFHGKSLPSSKESLTNLGLSEPQNETLNNKSSSRDDIFNSHSERPSSSQEKMITKKPYETKEVQIVTPFSERNTNARSSVKSLLNELKGKESLNSLQALDAESQDRNLHEQQKEKSHEEQAINSFLTNGKFVSVSDGVYTSDSSSKTKVTTLTSAKIKTNEDKEMFDPIKTDSSLKEREFVHQLDSTLILLSKHEAISSPAEAHQERNEHTFFLNKITSDNKQEALSGLAEVITLGDHDVRSKSEEQTTNNQLLHKEPPKPTARVPTQPIKGQKEGSLIEIESKLVPPKPMPRKQNKMESNSSTNSVSLISESSLTDFTVSALKSVVHKESPLKLERGSEKTPVLLDAFTLENHDKGDEEGSQSKADDSEDVSHFVSDGFKMATPADNLNIRDELPVIPERPEDEWLMVRNKEEEVTEKHPSDRPCSMDQMESSSHIPSEETWHPESKKDLIEKQSDQFSSNKANQNVASEGNKHVSYSNEPNQQKSEHQFKGINGMTENLKSDVSDVQKNNSPNESNPFLSDHSLSSPSALFSSSSFQLPSDTNHSYRAESSKSPTAESSDKAENKGKKKLLRAWVSPSETHPIQSRQSDGMVSTKHRPHPVKPMNATQTRTSTISSLGTVGKNQEHIEFNAKKYDPKDPASAYAQLTHDELIQLVLKQKETISKKELQVQELEDYIDNLLVRVMEETPSILRASSLFSKKAGKV